jgi:hypothetical protein
MEGDVRLRELLESKKAAIVDRWTDLTLQVYPPESARLMRREKDRFQNPVGRVTRESLESLFEGLRTGRPPEEMADALDDIVRIRAVQDLRPSGALAFLFLLKRAIREELGDDPSGRVPGGDDSTLESGIDRLALQAFDLFTLCREKIHDLRIGEIKRRTSVLLERMDEPTNNGSDEPAGCGACDNVNGGCEA